MKAAATTTVRTSLATLATATSGSSNISHHQAPDLAKNENSKCWVGWFGGTAAANVLSQWCGISFIAAE